MDNMQEIVYQLLAAGVSGIVGMVGLYARSYVKNKMKQMDYEFENSKVERILDNAVNYAEEYGKVQAKRYSKTIEGSRKKGIAREYIEKVDPEVVTKYGTALEKMIDRKVQQLAVRKEAK